jgi:O-antigen ligase
MIGRLNQLHYSLSTDRFLPSMALKRNLLLALFLISGSPLLLSAYLDLPLDLTLLGVAAAGLCIYLAIRFPECFLVAAVFAPQWKTFWIFRSLGQFADLTIAMLLCLGAGLAWRAIIEFGRMGHGQIRALFARQLNQILAYAVFAALVTTSYFYTNAPEYGGSKLLRFLLIGTLLFIAPFFLFLNEEDFRRFARLFIGFSALTAIQLITNLEARSQDAENDITRIGAGWLMGMAILLVIFYPLSRNRRWQRALLIFLLPLFLVGLMASAARGPMVALSVAVLIGVATLLKEGKLRVATALFLLLILVIGIGGAFLVLRQFDLGKYTAKAGELEALFTQGSSSGSAGKRVNFYVATLAALPNQPLIGTGIGSWSTFYFGNDQRNYPHNLLLEIAFEEGLIGLIAFLALLALVGVAILRMLKASRSHFLVLGLLVLYCVIISLFSGDLDDNRLLWLWIGVALSMCRLVQFRLHAFHVMQRAMRRTPAGRAQPLGAPAFSRHLASERYSLQKKDRAWGEKFVF